MRKSTNNCRSLVSKPTIKKQYEGYSLFGIVSCWTGREVCFFRDFPLYLDITFSRNFSHHAFLQKKVSLTHCFEHLFGTLPPVVARRHSDCGGNASSKAVPMDASSDESSGCTDASSDKSSAGINTTYIRSTNLPAIFPAVW